MSLILAENGKTHCKITIPNNACRVVRFASKELARYLGRMTGTIFPVVEIPDADIHAGAFLNLSADENAHGEKDAFQISSDGVSVTIKGRNPRSTLYGVYDFLEHLGCVFAEPGIDFVPSRTTLELAPFTKKSEAAFELRNIFRVQIFRSKVAVYRGLDPEIHLSQIDYMAKRKLNHYNFYVDYGRYDLWEKHKAQILDALLDRGFKLEVCHHSIEYFFPRDESSDYGNYGNSTYCASRPEWFTKAQARIERPEVREIITKRYLDYIAHNPELNMIGIWPGDDGMPAPEPGLTVADGYLEFWNGIASVLAKKYPDKLLSIIAYLDLMEPPVKFRGADNEQVWFCPIWTNYNYSMPEFEPNAQSLRQLETWVRRMPPNRVNVFDYFGWQAAFTPLARNVRKTIQAYSKLGVGGAYGWAGYTYNLMGNEYRWAKELFAYTDLLWNPDADVDALAETWARVIFGHAAENILAFYAVLERAHGKMLQSCRLPETRIPWIDLPLLHELQDILSKARKSANSVLAQRRIDLYEQVAANGVTAEVTIADPGEKNAPLTGF